MAGQDADLLGLDLEDLRHVAPHAEHALARDVQREASARGVVDADRRARLHRVHHHAAVDELEPRDMRGLGERGRHLLGVAVVVIERDIARRFVVDERRARARGVLAAATTAGSGSISTSTASAASFACSGVSATTKATGSPTKRTLSVGSAGRGGFFIGVPSRLLNGTMHLSVP